MKIIKVGEEGYHVVFALSAFIGAMDGRAKNDEGKDVDVCKITLNQITVTSFKVTADDVYKAIEKQRNE